MLDMLKRHEVQVLRKAGHNQLEVSALTGVSERSVRRIEAEPVVMDVDTSAERRRRRVGRPSGTEAFRQFITDTLKEEPALMSLELLRRARGKGYQGGRSSFYTLIASVRPKPVRPLVRFEGLPGEFCQHDFGQVEVTFLDGTSKRIQFFASRLKYSRWAEVTLVGDQAVESLVRALVGHYEAIGGIPLLAVFDRPKTIALKWRKDGTVTEWNPTFAGVVLDLGLGVELCWPYSGNQKGSVENLVGWVKNSFFKQRRFVDEADLRQQLRQWLEENNTRTPSRATGVVPAVRLVEDQARLRPLRVAPAELALRYPISVGPTAMVTHDTHRYSMPPETIGLPGTLYLYAQRVRIVAGKHKVEHPRLFERDTVAALPEHRAAMVAKVSGKRGKRYLKREHLLETGRAALEYLTEVIHRRPRDWVTDVDALHELLQQYGPDQLRRAFEQACAAEVYGAEYVRHFLALAQGGRENGPASGSSERPPVLHEQQQALPL